MDLRKKNMEKKLRKYWVFRCSRWPVPVRTRSIAKICAHCATFPTTCMYIYNKQSGKRIECYARPVFDLCSFQVIQHFNAGRMKSHGEPLCSCNKKMKSQKTMTETKIENKIEHENAEQVNCMRALCQLNWSQTLNSFLEIVKFSMKPSTNPTFSIIVLHCCDFYSSEQNLLR